MNSFYNFLRKMFSTSNCVYFDDESALSEVLTLFPIHIVLTEVNSGQFIRYQTFVCLKIYLNNFFATEIIQQPNCCSYFQ